MMNHSALDRLTNVVVHRSGQPGPDCGEGCQCREVVHSGRVFRVVDVEERYSVFVPDDASRIVQEAAVDKLLMLGALDPEG